MFESVYNLPTFDLFLFVHRKFTLFVEKRKINFDQLSFMCYIMLFFLLVEKRKLKAEKVGDIIITITGIFLSCPCLLCRSLWRNQSLYPRQACSNSSVVETYQNKITHTQVGICDLQNYFIILVQSV